MRTEVFGLKQKLVCDSSAIGVARDDAIPDSSFSASTYFSEVYYPWFGRLNITRSKGRGWGPKPVNDPADYLQIDLLNDYVICAVATQGANDINEWTTKYNINISFDSAHFYVYKENNAEKVFNGYSGRNDIMKHGLREYTLARFIRFIPIAYHVHKVLRVEVYGVLLSAVPSQAPGNLTVTAISSVSVKASWTLLPEYARHGEVTGYKLFYRQKGSMANSHMVSIKGEATLTKDVTTLDKYTKYEFQVLAVGSHGDGPKSSVKVEQTLEDAPSTPSNFSHSEIMPDKSAGPKIKLTWYKPAEENGIIRSYTVFYSHNEDPHHIHTETLGENMLSYTVDVLGGVTYQFHVRAVTIKPGPNATVSVQTDDYGKSDSVEYSGKKSYNNSFLHEGSKDVQGTTKCTLDNLVPGTKYEFQVYGISECGNKRSPTYLEKETEIGEPLAPVVPSLTIRKVSDSQAEVELWPAEQRNGPISAYQVIVLRVVDGVEKLPTEYKS
ncbi:protein sidekick-1-like, partial [Stylophora pistillata]|uniref:protein sidekick-1-like n=1 Tax=Stylophora pistillata TaxID=50429 RepID=UPI000C0454B7